MERRFHPDALGGRRVVKPVDKSFAMRSKRCNPHDRGGFQETKLQS